MCIDGSCQCPAGYLSVSHDTKCAKVGGKYVAEDLQTFIYSIDIQVTISVIDRPVGNTTFFRTANGKAMNHAVRCVMFF